MSDNPKPASGLQLKYFVLKPKGANAYARASRAAMQAYADSIAGVNPELAHDLRKWAGDEWGKVRFTEPSDDQS